MTQPRLPLFTTGTPQIVPTTELEILDLRGIGTNDQTRLVTVWLNYSSLSPAVGDDQNVTVWVQEGTDPARVVTVALVEQTATPLKVLDAYALRG